MRALFETISTFLYKWLLNQRGESFRTVWKNGHSQPDGMMWTLVFVLCVSLIVALIYYFAVVKSNASNDTKSNYLMTYILGYVALVAVTFVGLPLLITKISISHLLSLDMLMVCVANIVYYSLFFELWSLLFKKYVHSNTDLITIFK